MSTLKTTYLQHPSSGTANITLNSDGTVANAVGMGKILQVVSATKTDTFVTTNVSYTPVTGLSVSITPSSSSNKVLIIAQLTIGGSLAGTHVRINGGNADTYVGDAASNRVRSAVSLGQFASGVYETSYSTSPAAIVYFDSPATTSATTYNVEIRRGATSQDARINYSYLDNDSVTVGRTASSITVLEVAA